MRANQACLGSRDKPGPFPIVVQFIMWLMQCWGRPMPTYFVQNGTECHKVFKASRGTTLHIHNRFGNVLCEIVLTFLWVIICRFYSFHSITAAMRVAFQVKKQDLVKAVFSRFYCTCPCFWDVVCSNSPFLQGQPHKAFAVLKGDRIHAWCTLQRFCRSSNNNDHSVSCPVSRQ